MALGEIGVLAALAEHEQTHLGFEFDQGVDQAAVAPQPRTHRPRLVGGQPAHLVRQRAPSARRSARLALAAFMPTSSTGRIAILLLSGNWNRRMQSIGPDRFPSRLARELGTTHKVAVGLGWMIGA